MVVVGIILTSYAINFVVPFPEKDDFVTIIQKAFIIRRGYPYGENSDGEFPKNENRFDWSPWEKYSPFDTCASAQMIIKKVVKNDNKCQSKDRYSNILL